MRKTPYLKDWKKLADRVKDINRKIIQNILDVLHRAGMKAVRR